VLRRYAGHPRAARLYVATRLLTCPFPAVLRALPSSGVLLDVGCGAGVLCHLVADRGLTAVGIDPDARKIAWARASQTPGERVTFVNGGLDDAPAQAYAGVAFVDVLYLEPPDEQARLLAGAASRLAPGGRVVVKSTHNASRIKSWLTHLQEVAAVRGVGLTQGKTIQPPTVAMVRRVLTDAGLSVTVERVDRGYPHPHVLIVGQAP
jgi:2-polyprenyl-3-methyl-5-hydroxy-6-metoxy-1,4-benzoquinol methylase